MSCANTSLPWFIEPPRAMLPGRAAKPKFEIQIETKKINRLCVFHQQLTGAENPNVGTLLGLAESYSCRQRPEVRFDRLINQSDSVLGGAPCFSSVNSFFSWACGCTS